MNAHIFRSILTALLVTALSAPLFAAEPANVLLGTLKDPDPEKRIEALRELGTSLDPRLPEALLPLLADEGNSIRRLAARGVGSRWWQIPKERVPTFLKALERNVKSEHDDEANMVRRGLGLLRRDYGGDMFSRSPNKRWVVYERFGLPCLIDTTTGTEELLGWSANDEPAHLSGAWGNGPIAESAQWHRSGDIAAFDIGIGRRDSELWIWRHRTGLKKLGSSPISKALKVSTGSIQGVMGFFIQPKGWKGDELQFEVTFTTGREEQMTEHTAVLAYHGLKGTLRVISHTREKV